MLVMVHEDITNLTDSRSSHSVIVQFMNIAEPCLPNYLIVRKLRAGVAYLMVRSLQRLISAWATVKRKKKSSLATG